MRPESTTGPVLPSDAITRQAAEWLVRLSADDLAPAARAAEQAKFEQWQQVHPLHAQAAEQMARIIQQTQQLRAASASTTPARHAIEAALKENRRFSRAKHVALTLMLVMTLVLSAGFIVQQDPLAYFLADIRTAGEWKSQYLADRSRMTLNNNSAINITFNTDKRQLELVRGEILVDVATDAARPFSVKTRHGSIQALGTRFIVALDKQTTTLTMLESSALMQSTDQAGHRADELIIRAGQRASLSAHGISAVEQIDVRTISDAWKFRQLVVENRPLPQVLDELARYHTGYIHYDRAALKNMHVSAVLPLDDTEKAIQLLARSFPLRVRTVTPWLVIVTAAGDVPAGDTAH